MWEEAFSFFCQGLGANNFLQRLDLRNNQIDHHGAEELAVALKQNTSLQELGKFFAYLRREARADVHLQGRCSLPDLCRLVVVILKPCWFWNALQALCREWRLQPHGLRRLASVTGIFGSKPADEDCVLGAGQSLVEEGRGSFALVKVVGVPPAD